MRLEIVEATPELVARYKGEAPPFTFRGHVALLGDRVVGIGGIHYRDGLPVIFADFVEDMGRKDRARAFRFLEQITKDWKGRLFAVCDETRDTAPGLLRRLGFAPVQSPWWVRGEA